MTPDDRERNFEKALGRELRANGAKGLDCPDAETLAAFHERMLSPEEMAAQKSHIVDCPRCQEILATLEVTETIPGGAEDSEKVLEMSAKQTEAVPAEPVAAKAKGAAVKEMPKRKTYLRWAVPAGAIAAGLLVWIAMNTGRSSMTVKQKAPSAPVQVAENRAAISAEPDRKKSELERTPAAKPEVADKISRSAPGRQDGTLYQYEVEPQTKTEDRKRAEVPRTTFDHGPRAAQNQMNQNQMSQNQASQNNQIANSQIQPYGQRRIQPSEEKRLDDLEVAGRDSATLAQNAPRKEAYAKKAAAAPAAAAPAPPTVGGAAGTGAGADMSKDTEVGQVSETVTVTSEMPATANEQKADADKNAALMKLKGQMAGGLMAANLRDVKASTPGFVGTPDPRVFWFFMANGMVYRSEDGGKTTKLQKTGEGLKFLAGSAPDAKTCWLLGEKGIVLRTTNGGKKWETVSAPANGNFTMITGLDAVSALITDASGRVSYSTTDGGATWKLAPQK